MSGTNRAGYNQGEGDTPPEKLQRLSQWKSTREADALENKHETERSKRPSVTNPRQPFSLDLTLVDIALDAKQSVQHTTADNIAVPVVSPMKSIAARVSVCSGSETSDASTHNNHDQPRRQRENFREDTSINSQDVNVVLESAKLQHNDGWKLSYQRLFTLLCLSVLCVFVLRGQSHARSTTIHDALCVSGGGFSGLFYTFGQLDSLERPVEKDVYCYSSGCYCAFSFLANISTEEYLAMSLRYQDMWGNGTMHRYELLGRVAKELTAKAEIDNKSDDIPWLKSLKILSTVKKENGFGLMPSIRTPKNASDVHSMLVQTAWIPGITGNGLWYEGHMDGAFTNREHPKCTHVAGEVLTMDMLPDMFNMAMTADVAMGFWKAGNRAGVEIVSMT